MRTHQTDTRSSRPIAATGRPGFTLIELLTVIFIISILIAILLPALGAVQKSGKQAATQSLLVELNNAAASFTLDNRRQPGYFTQTELGSTINYDVSSEAGPGLTSLENAMLDLAGAGAIATEEPADPDNWVIVNPTDDDTRNIWVKADLLGADEGNYFLPAPSSLVHMSGPREQKGDITADEPGNSSLPDGLPDLVDASGVPILAWIENENGPRNIRSTTDFASLSVEDAPDGASRFYWASNGSMLASESLGEKSRSMATTPALNSDGSFIGSGAADQYDNLQIAGVMAALLGNPGYPDEASLAGGEYDTIFPRQARGGFIAHAAGEDGIFLGSDDSRFSRVMDSQHFGNGAFNITYGVSFFGDVSGGRRLGEDSQPETVDFLEAFDDVIVAQ